MKRWVAPGLRLLGVGGRGQRPDTGTRQGLVVGSITRELVQLAWPIAAAMLGETAMGLVDTKLVGGLGSEALGGVGMAMVLMFLSYSIVFGLMRGVKVRVAYAIGEGRPADAVRYVEAGVLIGALVGVVVFVFTRDATPVLVALRVAPETVPFARDFLAARMTTAVATCALTALVQWRQGVGDSRTPMVIGIAGNAVNAALAYALIHGSLGLPALGVRGAGYATAITESLELVVMATLLVRARREARGKSTIDLRRALREVLSVGGPTGVHFTLETLAFTAFTALLAGMGAAQMAAHQVALNTIRASFLPGVAVAEAASVLVARALGGRRLRDADRVLASALFVGVSFMTACGIAFGLFGGAIASAFTSDAEVITLTRRLLLVGAVFQALDACNMILRGSLRGAKDVRWVMFVGTAIVWVCLPGSALLFGRVLGLGALGGWIGFVFETTVATIVLGRRWARGSWRASFAASARDGESAPDLEPIGA